MIECLLQDYTGECRSELSDLIGRIGGASLVPESGQAQIRVALKKAYAELTQPTRDLSVVATQLIDLRRTIRNSIRQLRGLRVTYPYIGVIESTETLPDPIESKNHLLQSDQSTTAVSISYEELEAFHDALEAARCYWNKHPLARKRAAGVLRIANRLYWHLGEHLPKTGSPSERFLPVSHSTHGKLADDLVNFALDLSRDYTNKHDPWWADTVLMSQDALSRYSAVLFERIKVVGNTSRPTLYMTKKGWAQPEPVLPNDSTPVGAPRLDSLVADAVEVFQARR